MEVNTKRLNIKRTKRDNADFCVNIWLDDEMGKYLCDPPRDKANDMYENWKESVEVFEGWYYFIAMSKELGEYIGTCSAVPSQDNSTWDLGYAIHKKYWGQGYATEMIKALCSFCLDNGAKYATADVAKLNIGSNAVLHKLGFTIEKEGSFKKIGTDIVYESYTYKIKL